MNSFPQHSSTLLPLPVLSSFLFFPPFFPFTRYVQDFPRKRRGNGGGSSSPSSSPSSTPSSPFEQDLIEYIDSYQLPPINWGAHGGAQGGRGGGSFSSPFSASSASSLCDVLREFDFSAAYGRLVGSTPGRHSGGNAIERWGHHKLRALVASIAPRSGGGDGGDGGDGGGCSDGGEGKEKSASSSSSSSPSSSSSSTASIFGGGAGGCGSGEGGAEQRGGDIIVQFSSLGSLSSKWLHEFTLSLDLDSQRARVAGAGGAGGAGGADGAGGTAGGGGEGSKKRSRGKGKTKPPWTKDAVSPLCREKLKLVWPTVGEVRDSEEGYRAGSSIPGSQKKSIFFWAQAAAQLHGPALGLTGTLFVSGPMGLLYEAAWALSIAY